MNNESLKSEFLLRLSEFNSSLHELLEKILSNESSYISFLPNLVFAMRHIPSKKDTGRFLPEFIYTLIVMNHLINEIIKSIDDLKKPPSVQDKFRYARDYLRKEYDIKLNLYKN